MNKKRKQIQHDDESSQSLPRGSNHKGKHGRRNRRELKRIGLA